jgi:Cytochrome c7 and related cytochrome c/Cytochrome c554 and c-prime
MPRDESIAESAKQRSLRVPLDYYGRSDRLERAKLALTAIAATAAGLFVVWLLLDRRAGQRHASPGLLAGVHAAWNDECQACHASFQPLRPDSLSLAAFISSKADRRESLDQACLKCHNEPQHHAAVKADEVPSCAACHQEHRGASAQFVRPADDRCLSCHQAMEQHRTGPSGLAPPAENVTGFGPSLHDGRGPHPEFRSLASDPGNIKFNHWLHLQPGIAAADSRRKLTLTDLKPAAQPQYVAYAKQNGLVELDCAACHQPDAAGGAYMRPIAYEQHCRACHPLELNIVEGQATAEVPHGLSAELLTNVLDGLVLAAERTRYEPPQPTADESGDLPLIPGKTLGKNLAQKINQDVLARRVSDARAISAKCRQCHYEHNASAASDAPNVAPGNIPAAWLRHARFDHSAHRHIECRKCHQAAYAFEQRDKPQFIAPATGSMAARDDEEVMVAGLTSCAGCHALARGAEGGARQDCVECHNYHGGDARSLLPRASLGTPSAVPALSTPAVAAEIRLTNFMALAPTASVLVGSSSCAASGCHGSVDVNAPVWQTAFTKWAASDPHARAYDVLWTFRAREMTRLLSSANQRVGEHEHLMLLKQRCIGCHSTEAADESIHAFTLGVQCESCHGPAGQWLHTHDRSGFSRASTPGFIDTRDLEERSRACMGCHVGPSQASGQPQVVDHDLIAAGHPRLTFEFHSYSESLPVHWDRKADEERHGPAPHFQSWLAGQLQNAAQRQQLNRQRPHDFAHLDCFACHHDLTGVALQRQLVSGPLEPLIWPRTPLPARAGSDLSAGARLTLAKALLLEAADAEARWDVAVQSYLGTRAIMGDLTGQRYPQAAREIAAVQSALSAVATYLDTDCFPTASRASGPPTQYDSPTEFSWAEWAQRVQTVRQALELLEGTLSTR